MSTHFVSASSYARAAAALVGLAVAAAQAVVGVTEFSVGGTTTTASIQPTFDAFRSALGEPNNGNAPGPLGGGRREINWDGGGVNTATSTVGALTTFTNTRGATLSTPGTGFLQTPLNDAALTGIQPSYASTIGVFSLQRISTPLGSNVTEVTFSLPGTNGATEATIVGFGAVFSDVDLTNTTTIELYDQSNASLGVFGVPPGNAGTANGAALSFLGLLTNAGEKIARVLITAGNQALGAPDANGDNADVVARWTTSCTPSPSPSPNRRRPSLPWRRSAPLPPVGEACPAAQAALLPKPCQIEEARLARRQPSAPAKNNRGIDRRVALCSCHCSTVL